MKYYSEKLKKLFDAEKELISAEKTFDEQALVQKKELDIKKDFAKKVEDAYKEYVKTVRETNKIVSDTHGVYIKLRNDFINKYGSFHMSFTDKSHFETQSLTDLFDIFRFF
jgi:hypothetical protein